MGGDSAVLYSAGECPVGCAGPGLVFVRDASGGPIVVYCPDCKCAWSDPHAAEGQPDRRLNDLGVLRVRLATLADLRRAGLEELVQAQHPARLFRPGS